MPQHAEPKLIPVAVKVREQRSAGREQSPLVAVRRVADVERCFDPAGARCDGAVVDEDVEAGFSSVCAVAAFADAAEGEGGDVQGGVVDGGASGAGGCEDLSKGVSILSQGNRRGKDRNSLFSVSFLVPNG